MTLFHLIMDSETVLEAFSPVAIVDEIAKRCRGKGAIPVDIYMTEVK